jgi:DNA polymerase III alpha subunit (gram-positive type)
MENYVVYVCDTETTGLDPTKNEIVELSLIRMFLNSEKEDEQKTWLIRAMMPLNIQDEALAVNGHKREDVLGLSKNGKENYILPKDVLPQIENWMAEDDCLAADRVLAGHNALFDFNMIEAMWKRNDAVETFPFLIGSKTQLIDTKMLTLFIDILIGKKRKYYNLGSVIKAYGIKKEKAHRADTDTRVTRDLLRKQILPFIEPAKTSFSSTLEDEDTL